MVATVFAVLMSVAGAAGGASIPIEVAPGGVTDDVSTWDDTFGYLTLIPQEDLDSLTSQDVDSCMGTTSCTLTLNPRWDYLAVKADGFVALYWLAPYEGSLTIDVTNWGYAPIGGGLYSANWPNGGGKYPSISSLRAAAYPNPEPSSAVLFTEGGLIVGAAARRRAHRSSLRP